MYVFVIVCLPCVGMCLHGLIVCVCECVICMQCICRLLKFIKIKGGFFFYSTTTETKFKINVCKLP